MPPSPAMLIYGTRSITTNKAEGQFDCPRCGQQGYRHRRVRRFFTLYFIPLIPLNQLGEYIECHACGESYSTEVLDDDPGVPRSQLESEFRRAVRATMISMCLADGVIDDDEIATICSVYARLADEPLPEQQLRREIAGVQGKGVDMLKHLSSVAGSINDNGKELIVRAAFFVAAADGEFADEEKQMLEAIGQALVMSRAHLRRVLDELVGTPA